MQVDGKTGIAASLAGRNPNTGLDERVTVVTRALPDGHVIYFVFVTPAADSSRYTRVLSAMVQSLDVAENRAH